MIKVGDLYYTAGVDDEGKLWIAEHVVRTIRGGRAFLVQKVDGVSWVKDGAGKRATWGWAAYIPTWMRKRVRLADGVPGDYARSETQAVRVALREAMDTRAHYIKDEQLVAEIDAEIAVLTRGLARKMKAKAAKKAVPLGSGKLPGEEV